MWRDMVRAWNPPRGGRGWGVKIRIVCKLQNGDHAAHCEGGVMAHYTKTFDIECPMELAAYLSEISYGCSWIDSAEFIPTPTGGDDEV